MSATTDRHDGLWAVHRATIFARWAASKAAVRSAIIIDGALTIDGATLVDVLHFAELRLLLPRIKPAALGGFDGSQFLPKLGEGLTIIAENEDGLCDAIHQAFPSSQPRSDLSS